jgi:hypothetical protein
MAAIPAPPRTCSAASGKAFARGGRSERIGRRNIFPALPLLDLKAEFLDQGRPFAFLALDVGGVVVGRAWGWIVTSVNQLFFERFGCQGRAQALVEPLDNRAWHTGRSNQAIKRIIADRVEWIVMPDAGIASAALQTGQIDWWELVVPDLVPLLRTKRDLTSAQGANRRGNHPPFEASVSSAEKGVSPGFLRNSRTVTVVPPLTIMLSPGSRSCCSSLRMPRV